MGWGLKRGKLEAKAAKIKVQGEAQSLKTASYAGWVCTQATATQGSSWSAIISSRLQTGSGEVFSLKLFYY